PGREFCLGGAEDFLIGPLRFHFRFFFRGSGSLQPQCGQVLRGFPHAVGNFSSHSGQYRFGPNRAANTPTSSPTAPPATAPINAPSTIPPISTGIGPSSGIALTA